MLSIGDAHRLIDTHLGNSARAVHSQFVGRLMRRLAERTGGDPLLWELVGLCHDLDYEVTAGDWSRHGLVAAEWLANDLPSEGLDAIKAHDHRTGVISSLPISHALKLADALAIAHDHLGPDLVPLQVQCLASLLASGPESRLGRVVLSPDGQACGTYAPPKKS